MQPTINSPADLEALRGTPAFERALKALAGAIIVKKNIATYPATYGSERYNGPVVNPVWHHEVDNSALARIGMTRAEFDAELAAAELPEVEAAADEGEVLSQAELDAIDAAVEAATGADVNAERERRIAEGSTFAVTGYGDVPLTGRPQDQTALMGLLVKAQGLIAAGYPSAPMKVRDANNVNHELVPAQMLELVNAGMLWIEAVMAVSWDMKDGVSPFEAGIPADFADDAYWP